MCWEYVGKNAPWADVNIPRKHFDDIILPNMGTSMIRDIQKGMNKIGTLNIGKSPMNMLENANQVKGKKYKDHLKDSEKKDGGDKSSLKIKESSEIDVLNISSLVQA